jgi:hypothetical protein
MEVAVVDNLGYDLVQKQAQQTESKAFQAQKI